MMRPSGRFRLIYRRQLSRTSLVSVVHAARPVPPGRIPRRSVESFRFWNRGLTSWRWAWSLPFARPQNSSDSACSGALPRSIVPSTLPSSASMTVPFGAIWPVNLCAVCSSNQGRAYLDTPNNRSSRSHKKADPYEDDGPVSPFL